MKILKFTGKQTGLYCRTDCGLEVWRSSVTTSGYRVYKVHIPDGFTNVRVMFRYTSDFLEWLEERIGSYKVENDDEYISFKGARFTEDHTENILHYHRQGWTVRKISEAMTCSIGAVQQVLYANNQKPNPAINIGVTGAEATAQAGLQGEAVPGGQCEMFNLKAEGGSAKCAENTQATESEQSRRAA